MLAKTFVRSLVLVIAVTVTSPAVNPGLRDVKSIYVEPQGRDATAFDKALKMEIIRQFDGVITVTDKQSAADAILKGEPAAEPKAGMGKRITGKLGLNDVSVGSLVLYKREDKDRNILWMQKAGDRYLWLGPMSPASTNKIAERLVKKLRRDYKAAH